MKKKLLRYTLETEQKIMALVGKGRGLTQWINQAIEEKLQRDTVKG